MTQKTMVHITSDDLAKKSDAQLKSLFNQVSLILDLIRDEIASRALRP